MKYTFTKGIAIIFIWNILSAKLQIYAMTFCAESCLVSGIIKTRERERERTLDLALCILSGIQATPIIFSTHAIIVSRMVSFYTL